MIWCTRPEGLRSGFGIFLKSFNEFLGIEDQLISELSHTCDLEISRAMKLKCDFLFHRALDNSNLPVISKTFHYLHEKLILKLSMNAETFHRK